MTDQPTLTANIIPAAGVVFVQTCLFVQFERQGGNANFPCAVCAKRRVRYRIVAGNGGLTSATEARCLECWTDPFAERRISAVQQTPVDQLAAGLVPEEKHYENLSDAD